MEKPLKPILDKAIRVRNQNPLQQFGQQNDRTTFNGATACTHTILQYLVQLWTGRHVSLDQISQVAGYPSPGNNPNRRGLRWYEVQRVMKHYKLPYTLALGLSVEQLLRASNKAPVLYGVRYGDYPVAKGKPEKRNGYAEKNGATQTYGFDGAHACCLLGYEKHGTTHYDAYSVEPNHNSGRQESPTRPPYDIITTQQLRKAFESIKTAPGWNRTYAFIPTRALPV